MYNLNEQQSQSALVARHAPLVKRIALHLLARLPASVIVDDLIQSGMVGLLEAARRFDARKGASFETFAGIRIRGAIIDEVRKGDWTPRSVHRNSRQIAECIQAVESRSGRDAQDHEIAQEMGVDLDTYYAYLRDSASSRLFSVDEMREGRNDSAGDEIPCKSPSPELHHERDAFQQALAHEIGSLPEREKLVLSLYYTEELNLKEIGQVLGVSESRVSQIHSQAAQRLKGRLVSWHRA